MILEGSENNGEDTPICVRAHIIQIVTDKARNKRLNVYKIKQVTDSIQIDYPFWSSYFPHLSFAFPATLSASSATLSAISAPASTALSPRSTAFLSA